MPYIQQPRPSDKKQCYLCGATRNTAKIDLHHILPTKLGFSPRPTPNNTIHLCSRCHHAAHKNPIQFLLTLNWAATQTLQQAIESTKNTETTPKQSLGDYID